MDRLAGMDSDLLQSLSLRPITPEDLPFLRQLYGSTREEELAMTGWPQPEVDAFLDMQFKAQHQFYQDQFPEAEFNIIQRNQEPVGRLYLDRRDDEFRLIDIALLTSQRNQGIGSHYMQAVLKEAGEKGLAVRIHVEQNNSAMHLYLRLGFRKIDETGIYHLMERPPTTTPDSDAHA